MSEGKLRVSVDIGGTFTDLVLEKPNGGVFVYKIATTPRDLADGVLSGIDEIIDNPEDIAFFVHGTTVGLNAFLERKGERVLLIMTEGVEDVVTIARGHRRDINSAQYRKPAFLVSRRDVHTVRERLDYDGSVVVPPCMEDLDPIINKIRHEGIMAVAVCLLHSYANPEHEIRIGQKLKQEIPEISVSLSHRIASEWREYERSSSAVMNGYIAPTVELYLSNLEKKLRSKNVPSQVYVMQSNGGVTTASDAKQTPIVTLMSGPVGGAIGGAALTKLTGRRNLVCVDMGGTSFDVSLIINGKPDVVNETELSGLPLLMPTVNIHTIGAGGGSMVWFEGGGIRVGPQSAGSEPGPICYARGGEVPTITDANLYLRRLGRKSLLQGRMELDFTSVKTHFESISADINMSGAAFAQGMLAINNAKMADAVRTITIQQGIDPRDFVLVAFGGAGPLHAAWIAAELDIKEIIVPCYPGTFSAWGMLQTDIRHDFVQNCYRPSDEMTTEELLDSYSQLSATAMEVLSGQSISNENMLFQFYADLRYVGQEFAVTIPIAKDDAIEKIKMEFHSAYYNRYGHSTPETAVEFVNLRMAAYGILKHIEPPAFNPVNKEAELIEYRNVVLDGEVYEAPVYKRVTLPTQFNSAGPLILEEESATTVIPKDWSITLDHMGNISIKETA